MKIAKNRRASEMWAADTILWWLIFGVILGFAAVFFVVTISKIGFQQAKINENIESLFLLQRFLKSSECFVYDKDGIVLYGVVDYSKFTQDRLNLCYAINEMGLPAFRLNLKSASAGIDNTIQTKNWNRNIGFEEKKAPRNVYFYFQNMPYKGEMTIEIQNLQ